MILVPITYKGGVFRHDEILDLIEDMGGYIIQKHMIAQEVVLQALVPKEDIDILKTVSRPLAGEVIPAPLVGTEIAVVSMSLEIHHLPHASCDVAEYLRTAGAKTNMIGLARGFGKRIGLLSDEERDIINEHDLAIYLFGNFETCIQQKMPTFRRGIKIPLVVCGGPSKETLMKVIDPPVAGYIGGMGRFMHRTKEPDELARLDEIVAEVTRVVDQRRTSIAKDPLSIAPARLMDVILESVPDIHEVTSPVPVVVQMDGIRVKLPYDPYAGRIKEVEIESGIKIADICDLRPSRMRDYILMKVKPFSETGMLV
ncbi:methanogenesis marker 7 protein [Methanospirillum stamsii]|uniref:Methanogenesis marker 7 protein n=1 Tax=Methanospirillum stamsii TaxID=1277351 RepID=A0A2V2N144_9EURY|nr:methanogenesis marker 7 protein [Methanospirillum stamsii]PWR73479.1 methanogenesis marker 7 protein [Methanospirillum stamsii]